MLRHRLFKKVILRHKTVSDINYVHRGLLDPSKGAENSHHAPCDVTGVGLGIDGEMPDFQERRTLRQCVHKEGRIGKTGWEGAERESGILCCACYLLIPRESIGISSHFSHRARRVLCFYHMKEVCAQDKVFPVKTEC